MLVFELDKRVKGDLENIWGILTDNQCFSEVAPDITRVETVSGAGQGMVRRIHHESGRIWKEECKEWEPSSRFTMQINVKDYPLPVNFMRRIIRIQKKQKNTVITLRYEYTPRYGPFGFLLDRYRIRPILKIFARQLLNNFANKIHQQAVGTSITAATMLKDKGPALFTITPDTLIIEACQILTRRRIGSLIVLNDEEKIAGIVSERDIVNGMSSTERPDLNKPVREVMNHDAVVCRPDHQLSELIAIMSEHRIRHLPVVDNDDHPVGVISIGDIVNVRMTELEQKSAAMQQYIEGRKWRETALQIGRNAASGKPG